MVRSLPPLALALLVACGPAAPGPGPAAADLGPPGVAGEVAGEALRLLSARVEDDVSCGARGLLLVLGTEDPCAAGDAGAGAASELRVHLSDRLPGVYLFTGPVTCLAPPGGKGLDASLRGAGPAVGGFAILGAWDERTAEGSLDLSFAATPGGAPLGRLSGNFVAPRCP